MGNENNVINLHKVYSRIEVTKYCASSSTKRERLYFLMNLYLNMLVNDNINLFVTMKKNIQASIFNNYNIMDFVT